MGEFPEGFDPETAQKLLELREIYWSPSYLPPAGKLEPLAQVDLRRLLTPFSAINKAVTAINKQLQAHKTSNETALPLPHTDRHTEVSLFLGRNHTLQAVRYSSRPTNRSLMDGIRTLEFVYGEDGSLLNVQHIDLLNNAESISIFDDPELVQWTVHLLGNIGIKLAENTRR